MASLNRTPRVARVPEHHIQQLEYRLLALKRTRFLGTFCKLICRSPRHSSYRSPAGSPPETEKTESPVPVPLPNIRACLVLRPTHPEVRQPRTRRLRIHRPVHRLPGRCQRLPLFPRGIIQTRPDQVDDVSLHLYLRKNRLIGLRKALQRHLIGQQVDPPDSSPWS